MLSLPSLRAVTIIVSLFSSVPAQDLPDPSTCADPNQSFAGCEILKEKSSTCGNISVNDQTGIITCFCTQEVFSSIIE